MKKNNIFYACAAAALVFASCQKEAPAPVMPQTDGMNVITATTLSTKTTTLDGVNMVWENADQIRLFTRTWNEGESKYVAGWCDYTTTLDAPSATATFVRDEANTNTVDNTSGRYLALHYKGAKVVTQSRNYNAQFVLLPNQTAKNGGDFTSSIMVATSENAEFQFSHLVSYVKFTVDANSTPFNKLVVQPVSTSEKVITRIAVDWANELTVTVKSGNTEDSRFVTLTTENNANFAPGTYYVAVNPNTYADGLTFTFENEAGQTYEKTSPANVTMKPGDVANMGTVGTLTFEEAPAEPEPFKPSIYVENGVNKGVVFWADPADPTKGLAISGKYADQVVFHGTYKTFEDAAEFDTDNSIANFQHITNWADYQADKTKYPAIYFCESLGEGWRLPSKLEMENLFRTWSGYSGSLDAEYKYTASEVAATADAFDALMLQCEGEAKLSIATVTWYWLGQADSATKKPRRTKFASSYLASAANATNYKDIYVRCVRDVELQ